MQNEALEVKYQINNKLKFSPFQKYNGIYNQEKSLNDGFNNFVKNYELAYCRPNTAFHQIGSPYKDAGQLIFNVKATVTLHVKYRVY